MFIEAIARGKEYSRLIVDDIQLPVQFWVSVGAVMIDVSESKGVFCRLWSVGMRREKRPGASRKQDVLIEADITADDCGRAWNGKGRCQQQRGGDPASRTASGSGRYHGANLA